MLVHSVQKQRKVQCKHQNTTPMAKGSLHKSHLSSHLKAHCQN